MHRAAPLAGDADTSVGNRSPRKLSSPVTAARYPYALRDRVEEATAVLATMGSTAMPTIEHSSSGLKKHRDIQGKQRARAPSAKFHVVSSEKDAR